MVLTKLVLSDKMLGYKGENMKVPFITTAMGINVILEGKSRLIPKDHQHHDTILSGLRAGNYEVVSLLDEMKKKIEDFDGVDFQLSHGELLYRGKPYENTFVTRQVMTMLDKGYKAQPLLNFLSKVEQNPHPESVKDLWKFMENTGLAITDDGDVLAFKYVTKVSDMYDGDERKSQLLAMGAEYTDDYSKKFDYTPGKTPGVPRHLCPYEPGKDCGVGLHIGDLSYVKNHSHILAVSFSPADVTSIGAGESRKIRVARFKCLHILNPEDINDKGYKEPVYNTNSGSMSYSNYAKSVGAAPVGYVDHPSAEHWGK